jgi:hypothetical protein
MNHYAVDTLHYNLAAELTLASPAIPHELHKHKEFDLATGERPELDRPFIAVALGLQPPQIQAPKANSFQQPYRDRTRALIYVESPLSWHEGNVLYGGFDRIHVPAVNFIRNFIASYRALPIPLALSSVFGTGNVAMTPDQPPEVPARLKDGERHVFYVLLTYFTTTDDSVGAS